MEDHAGRNELYLGDSRGFPSFGNIKYLFITGGIIKPGMQLDNIIYII